MLTPLRRQILDHARAPASATTIAAALGLPRQKVNYHVRALADAGYLKKAGRAQKRGLVEQRWIAADRTVGTAALMVLLGGAGRELAAAARGRADLPVLALDVELGFAGAEDRAAFARALTDAIGRVVAEHASAPGAPGTRRFRLIAGCYPTKETRR